MKLKLLMTKKDLISVTMELLQFPVTQDQVVDRIVELTKRLFFKVEEGQNDEMT